MGDIKNVLHSKAALWVDGNDIGFTAEPVEFNLSKDFFDIEVEQVKGVVGTTLVKEDLTISTSLSEVTLDKLRIAWDTESSKLIGGTFLAIGTEVGSNTHTLTIVLSAPTGSGKTYMNYFIFKAVSYEATNLSFAKGENTKIPITFKCIKDTLNDNKFGYVTLSNVAGG